MKESFILYSVIDVGDNPVDCVYLDKDDCRAVPYLPKYKEYYKPTEEEQKEFCKNPDNPRNFLACSRLQAYQNHLKAIGVEKEEATD